MSYLLDSHALLWYLLDDENLSKNAHSIIDTEECFYSNVSLWEIAIKQSLGKLNYKETIPSIIRMCEIEQFFNLPVSGKNIETIKTLPFIHNDPFDRLLIAQAQNENLTIITRDAIISRYDVKTVW